MNLRSTRGVLTPFSIDVKVFFFLRLRRLFLYGWMNVKNMTYNGRINRWITSIATLDTSYLYIHAAKMQAGLERVVILPAM